MTENNIQLFVCLIHVGFIYVCFGLLISVIRYILQKNAHNYLIIRIDHLLNEHTN